MHPPSPPVRRRRRPPDGIAQARFPDLKLALVYRAVESLKPSTRQARTHSEAQIDKIASSIRMFGFTQPVILNEDDAVIAGHAPLQAAARLGLAVVPTVQLRHLGKEDLRALRLADNRLAELAGWDAELLRVELAELDALALDFSLEITGFTTGEIDVILDGPPCPKADPADAVPDLAALAVSRPGDLWRLDRHRLLCGSALEEASYARLLGGETAQAAFIDPPYNGHVSGLGRTRHREFAMASGEMSEEAFTTFLLSALVALAAAPVNGAVLYVCMDWRHLYELQSAARRAGLTLLNLCVWAKTNAGMGSFYRSQHELVLVFKVGTDGHLNMVELGRHGRHRSNLWSHAGMNGFGAGRMETLASQPTCKPVGLVADAIRDCTRRGDLVLDGFGGSGSTLIAAHKAGRRAALIELDPNYVDVTIRRFEALTGKAAVLADTGEIFAEVAARRAAEVDHG